MIPARRRLGSARIGAALRYRLRGGYCARVRAVLRTGTFFSVLRSFILSIMIKLQYRQEILTTFAKVPYYGEYRKQWVYLGAPMVDLAEIWTGSSFMVSEHDLVLGSS